MEMRRLGGVFIRVSGKSPHENIFTKKRIFGFKRFQLLRVPCPPPNPVPDMSEAVSPQQPQSTEAELIAVRREKLAKLRELGVDPYGARFDVSITPSELRSNFAEGLQVKVAGRITALRDMGKSCFFSLADIHGSIQGYMNVKALDETGVAIWKCLDRGDWIGIEGETFLTKTGEPTVKMEKFTVLSKSLRPMPDKWHGLADREIKYRKRHLDLMGNPDSAALFVKRSLMIAEIRRFLQDRGFLEVETPMLQDVAGGAAARPFETYHNALGMPLTLRIAPELFLKRLLVGGFTKIFELNRSFRNEGISRRHNPEFTMLEAYWAFSDFEQMADLVEELTCHLAEKFCGGLNIEHKDEDGNVTRTINLARPWKRASYHDLIKLAAGDDFFEIDAAGRRARCGEKGVQISDEHGRSRSHPTGLRKAGGGEDLRSLFRHPRFERTRPLGQGQPGRADGRGLRTHHQRAGNFPRLFRTQRPRCSARALRGPVR